MMILQIFDVSHGFCALLIADNGNVMLFDCGHNDRTGFRPSWSLPRSGCTGIETFFITNYDDDHVSDLANLRRSLQIDTLHCNRSMPIGELEAMKRKAGPLTEGLRALFGMLEEYRHEVTTPPQFPYIDCTIFCNQYPSFVDTNNLSLVVFLHYDGMGMIFPGDLI